MESTVQSLANGHAVGSALESTECKPLANGSTSDADRLNSKEDVQEFLNDAKANADLSREESDEADAEMSDEELEQPPKTLSGCDRVEPLSLADSLWKLDRRASGHLFWRRDSSTLQDGVDPSSRVKFRYDVTVREYAEQQQEESEHDDDESAEEEEVDGSEGSVLRQRKGLTVTRETDKGVKSSTGVASSPFVIYSAVLFAVLMAAAIHWYLWGRTAWANLTGGRRGGSSV